MKWIILLAALSLSTPVMAGQTTRVYVPPVRGRVVYVVPLYPTHTISRGCNTGINRMPYNPVYHAGRVTAAPANRSAYVSRSRSYSSYSGSYSSYSGSGSGPAMIYNPYCK